MHSQSHHLNVWQETRLSRYRPMCHRIWYRAGRAAKNAGCVKPMLALNSDNPRHRCSMLTRKLLPAQFNDSETPDSSHSTYYQPGKANSWDYNTESRLYCRVLTACRRGCGSAHLLCASCELNKALQAVLLGQMFLTYLQK